MAYRQLCLLGFVLGFVFEWGTGIGPLPTTGVWIGLEAAYLKAWCRIHLSVPECPVTLSQSDFGAGCS